MSKLAKGRTNRNPSGKMPRHAKWETMILADDIESLHKSKLSSPGMSRAIMKYLLCVAADNGKVIILDFLYNTPCGETACNVLALARRSVEHDQPSVLEWALDTKGLGEGLAEHQLNQFWSLATKFNSTKILQFATQRNLLHASDGDVSV
jgi:hypothetical protein